MAAAQQAFNNYLTGTLNIPAGELREALNAQGFNSFDALRNFSDQDVKDVAEIIRRPGGRIPNPSYTAATPVAGVPTHINDPGVRMGFGHIKHLRQLVYFARFYHTIQRPLNTAAATLPRITALWRFKEALEEESSEISMPEKMTSVENARQTVEDIDSYLSHTRGVDEAPLSYVTREDSELPVDDPGFDNMGLDEQLIRRSSHTGHTFRADNQAVWALLYRVFHDSPGWNWISAHTRTKDGRAAYLSMKTHYLGESYQDRLRSNAEAVIERSFYDGTSRNFTLEKLFERLNGAFVDLSAAGEPVGDTRKIRILLRSIENADHLRAARANLVGNPLLRPTFASAVNYLSQFAAETSNLRSATGRQPRQAASMRTGIRGNNARGAGRGRGGRDSRISGRSGRGGREGRGGRHGRGRGRDNQRITDRYYTEEEWGQLLADQRQEVRRLREDRDRRRGVAAIRNDNNDTNDRNVRQRQEDNTDNMPASSGNSGAGSFMSQRPQQA